LAQGHATGGSKAALLLPRPCCNWPVNEVGRQGLDEYFEKSPITDDLRSCVHGLAARRLDETPIDYSDIPPLFGEDWITALLLAMLIEHCAACSPEARRRMTSFLTPDPSPEQWLDSYNIPANAEAMRELDSGEIEITEQDGAHIVAKVTPEGRALLDRLRAQRERKRS
jgi:hypothetical protein